MNDALLASNHMSVCSELSAYFPRAPGEQAPAVAGGEVDFYLNSNDVRWGIELVVPGRGTAEHAQRFKTKYAPLEVNDHIVIDFPSTRLAAPPCTKDATKR